MMIRLKPDAAISSQLISSLRRTTGSSPVTCDTHWAMFQVKESKLSTIRTLGAGPGMEAAANIPRTSSNQSRANACAGSVSAQPAHQFAERDQFVEGETAGPVLIPAH